MRRAALVAAALAMPLAAAQPQLVPDTSIRELRIEYSFRGADLLLFGAILYPDGRPPRRPADVIVVVRGPTQAVVLREKKRIAGMWMNADERRFASAPSFYAIASTRPLAEITDRRTAEIYEFGLDSLQLSPGTLDTGRREAEFERGLRALMQQTGLYVQQPGGVELNQGVLYRAQISIPSRVPVGTYTAETFLVDRGKVIATETRDIEIGKAGFERFVALAAREHGLAYGLVAVALSVSLGWAAAWLFNRRA